MTITTTTMTPTNPAAATAATADPAEDTVQPQDLAEIQGIILRGYKLGFVRHFVLQITNAPAFKQFLGKLVPNTPGSGPLTITSAAPFPKNAPRPDYYLNVGFSWPGLQALNLPGVTFGNNFQFQAFKAGATNRAAQVGDVGPNAPQNWLGALNPANAQNAHVIFSLYADTPENLELRSTTLRNMFETPGAAKALTFDDGSTPGPDHFDGIALPNGTIHFGYADGISQPRVQGMEPVRPEDQQRMLPAWGVVVRNTLNAPYPFPQPAIFTRNGGFAAFRILEQDVAGFDAYSKSQPGTDPELLVAKMCGRWRNGNPLALCPVSAGAPLPDDQLGNFSYADDPNGDKTPIGSHTRRGNPRDSEDVVAIRPFHRIVRRAMPYGPAWKRVKDNVSRGLVGWFVGTSLEQQFEFIMRVWLIGQNFSSNFSQPQGVDPLFGGADPTKQVFDFPPNGHVTGFEQFITTRGGMYAFLPSIPALQWMSQQT